MSVWLLVYYTNDGSTCRAQMRIYGIYTTLAEARLAQEELLGDTRYPYINDSMRNVEGTVAWVSKFRTNTVEDALLTECKC